MAVLLRGLIAVIAWAGLGIQLGLLLASPAFASPTEALWRFLSYFTVLTNLLVAVTMTVTAVVPRSAAGRFLLRANPRAAVVLSIGLVGVVYHLLLARNWSPEGWQLVADQIMHTAIPLLVLAEWLVFARKRELAFRFLPYYLAWPIAYTVYAMGRGRVDGHYPYPFLNPPEIGYLQTALNTLAIAAGFSLGAALLILAGRFLSRDLPASLPGNEMGVDNMPPGRKT